MTDKIDSSTREKILEQVKAELALANMQVRNSFFVLAIMRQSHEFSEFRWTSVREHSLLLSSFVIIHAGTTAEDERQMFPKMRLEAVDESGQQ